MRGGFTANKPKYINFGINFTYKRINENYVLSRITFDFRQHLIEKSLAEKRSVDDNQYYYQQVQGHLLVILPVTATGSLICITSNRCRASNQFYYKRIQGRYFFEKQKVHGY